jgi:hypothetical protein
MAAGSWEDEEESGMGGGEGEGEESEITITDYRGGSCLTVCCLSIIRGQSLSASPCSTNR